MLSVGCLARQAELSWLFPRPLHPSPVQALCMVHSWPFYPDQKQIEAAVKEKAGPLWEQLARSAS